MREVLSRSEEQTRALGREVGAAAEPGDVFFLEGDLGAGKTTFTKGVAEACGVTAMVRSPTFALMHRYRGDPDVVHLDLYRQGEDGGLDDLAPETWERDVVVLVEWPRSFARERWPGARTVRFEHVDETTRRIVLAD